MRNRRNDIEERRVERPIADLWRRIATLSDDELLRVSEAARANGERLPKPRRRFRWSIVVATLALLVGSGLGFGLGSSVTPSGSAGGSFAGFGFIPARGWNVMQTGTLDRSGVARAVAANVPLDRSDDLGGPPLATIESLPADGVVLVTSFSTRGDPAEDFSFPVRTLPLRLADAEHLPAASDPVSLGGLARYRLSAAVGGYNVDARIYFGTDEPSTQALASAQRQLNRLVVASERVTLSARPTISGTGETVWLFGSVENGRAGEVVDVQAKDCGQQFFRGLTGATTTEGGAWRTNFFPSINTSVRAIWKDSASAAVTIQKRAHVLLRQRSAKRFSVSAHGANSTTPFWRKRVLFQRFDRRVGSWKTVKRVVLTTSSPSGTEFTASLPKGTLVRAVIPLSQTRPCWVAGVSRTFRRE